MLCLECPKIEICPGCNKCKNKPEGVIQEPCATCVDPEKPCYFEVEE